MNSKLGALIIVLLLATLLSGCIPGYRIDPNSERLQDAIIKEEIIEIHNIYKNDTIIQLYKPVPTRVIVYGNRNTVEIEEATDLRFVEVYGADNVVYIPEEKKELVNIKDSGFETTVVYY